MCVCARVPVCVYVWDSLNTDQQWQLPVSASRNATLQTCHPTLSDPQYYGCLQVTLHNCLCLSIPASVSLPLSLFFSLVSLYFILTSISHIISLFVFLFCSYTDSSAVLFFVLHHLNCLNFYVVPPIHSSLIIQCSNIPKNVIK